MSTTSHMTRSPLPTLRWYMFFSHDKGVPLCPFASVHRCPRYFQRLALMGRAGSTSIDPAEEEALTVKWKTSDLWPTTREQDTTLISHDTEPHAFWRFCPEVTGETFSLFASDLARYSDELDIDLGHAQLAKDNAPTADWRWSWAHVSPMHYTECPLYSPLQHSSQDKHTGKGQLLPTGEDIVDLKPNLFGFGLNLNALTRRLKSWWIASRQGRGKRHV